MDFQQQYRLKNLFQNYIFLVRATLPEDKETRVPSFSAWFIIIIIGSANGLVLSDTNVFPKPVLTQFFDTIRRHHSIVQEIKML